MIARSEVVGSLLRPKDLAEARQGQGRGEESDRELKRVEDRAVSKFYAEVDYEPFARIFQRTLFKRFLLEYDDERSGGFAPLRHLPEDRVVVLGLVTTKKPDLEPADELRARVKDASKYVPLDRLALSPQCGFAPTMEGNRISPEQQRQKLELVGRVAKSLW